MCFQFNICCSPALVGFIFIQPHSYVYRFDNNNNSKELVVIKTRTLHNPLNSTNSTLSGPLIGYEGSGCSAYEEKIVLINFGHEWDNFKNKSCNPKAAIIKDDDEMGNRSSSPITKPDEANFPIVMIYEKDEKKLGESGQATILFTDDKEFPDVKVPCNDDSCTRLVS